MVQAIKNPAITRALLKNLTQQPTVYKQQAEQLAESRAQLQNAVQRASQIATTTSPEKKKLTKLEIADKISKIIGRIGTAVLALIALAKGAKKAYLFIRGLS